MPTSPPPRWISTPTGFLMVLREGDDVFAQLEALTVQEDVPSASFMGFGFLRRATFGFYDFERREYRPQTFEQLELANMTGTLAWKEGKPSVHAHGVAGDAGFTTVGGHLLGLEVGTGSLEITIIRHERRLERKVESRIGANILSLGTG